MTMRKFRVLLHGRNFLIRVAGKGELKHGFFTNCFVEAADENAAELLAVDRLRARQSLREVVLNSADDPPRVFVEEVAEVPSFDGLPSLEQGLAWYRQDAAESPQPPRVEN